MAIMPADFTAALLQAKIDRVKANQLVGAISTLITNLQNADDSDVSIPNSSISRSISNIEAVESGLKTYWVDNPEFAHTSVIQQTSSTLTTLNDIQTSVVQVLEQASKYSPALFSQLRAVNTASTEIRKYVYPRPLSSTKTETVIDDMSLTNLKIYSSFLGIASKVTAKKNTWINVQVELLQTIKSWLTQYQEELQRRGIGYGV